MYSNAKKNDVVLMTNPEILAINIIDNQECMIDLKYQQEIFYGSSPEVPDNTDYTKLRTTVYDKLKQAQKLLPSGLCFCLYEGYRSLNLQKILFDNRFKKIRNLHPDWSHSKIFNETTKLVSPVTNEDGSRIIPPHSTGGAIDIYLINDAKLPIDMGIHPKDWMKDDDGLISLTKSPVISNKAQNNRYIMSKALTDAGFVNYPGEYWHWSYGDRYWAYHMNKSYAVYGSYDESNIEEADEQYLY